MVNSFNYSDMYVYKIEPSQDGSIDDGVVTILF